MKGEAESSGLTSDEAARPNILYSHEQRARRACLQAHLATAARVKYPAALQRCKFDAPLLAAGILTWRAIALYFLQMVNLTAL